MRQARGRTTRRSELERHTNFTDISPEVGQLNEAAFDAAMTEDPDATLALLAGLATAFDERLRELARRLAGRVILDRARRAPAARRGVGRLRAVPADRVGADLDLDRSMSAIAEARLERRVPHLGDLQASEWGEGSMATCLIVDRSGSMAGDRLAGAALAAAACAWRAPTDHAVLVFADTVIAVQSMGQDRSSVEVVNDLLSLRGRGTTDLAAALRGAEKQLRRSRAKRKVCILLSDCRHNVGDDPRAVAAGLDELVVVAPADDSEEAVAFCRSVGARSEYVSGPTATMCALGRLLS